MNNKISRRSLFSLIASVPAVMLIVPETKLYTINHPAFAYIYECAEKNVRADFNKFRSDSIKGVDLLCGSKELPKRFINNYKIYIEENWGENFKETVSPRERYHHLLNTIQNQWKPEGYKEHFEPVLIS